MKVNPMLRAESQSARMSKITNDGLTRSATGCFIAVAIWQQWGCQRVSAIRWTDWRQIHGRYRYVTVGRLKVGRIPEKPVAQLSIQRAVFWFIQGLLKNLQTRQPPFYPFYQQTETTYRKLN